MGPLTSQSGQQATGCQRREHADPGISTRCPGATRHPPGAQVTLFGDGMEGIPAERGWRADRRFRHGLKYLRQWHSVSKSSGPCAARQFAGPRVGGVLIPGRGPWTVDKTETNLDVKTAGLLPDDRVAASQRGGGCEIRTREGLNPTRFPTMLTGVHQRPPLSANCANTIRVYIGELSRTAMNETQTETEPRSPHTARAPRRARAAHDDREVGARSLHDGKRRLAITGTEATARGSSISCGAWDAAGLPAQPVRPDSGCAIGHLRY
jgi:hypothetical protein